MTLRFKATPRPLLLPPLLGAGMRLRSPSTCPACGGRGVSLSEACPACSGHGVRRQRRLLRVRVPPGADEGSVLRLRGCGDLGRGGGPPGDVEVRFQVGGRQ